ncbi:MAG: TonB family protein [Bacteroidota bacterium]
MKTPKFLKESVALLFIIAILMVVPFTIISRNLPDSKKAQFVLNDPLLVKDKDDDKTLSPYFYVNSENAETDQLPLKSTSAKVNIAGVIADVTVTQVYMNAGSKPIEAIYVFPASTRAAVYGMTMTVGDRLLIAKIKEKQQARQDYETAKQQGKSASLLEQQRPNVFQMNVANIMPGDTIRVELHYTELLIPEGGVYEFDYPTVVGPRYSNKPEATASANDQWVSNPYQHEGEKPLYAFDFDVTLDAGMPIRDIRCPSHNLNINYEGTNIAHLILPSTGKFEGNRDVIIQYRLAENKLESGLLLYQGNEGEENFFLTMIQPPARPTEDQIAPREYIFVMDVSGSMYGYPIDVSKKLLTNLIGKLRATDKFNVLLFAGGSSTFADQSVFATPENLKKALNMIDNQQGGGGTELLPALKKALTIEKQNGFSRTFVIATDGYVDVEKESFQLIRDNLGKANFFAFGIGTSVNRFLIEGIANAGMGEPFIVTDAGEADKQAEKFRNYIQTPVLTDIKVTYEGFDAYDMEPANVPDVLAERPVIIFGKWKNGAKGTIKLTGKCGSEKFTYTYNVGDVKPEKKNSALKYLWVRQKIRMLDDFNNAGADDKLKEEITGLGLKYNLLTNYTSFVAIDSIVRNVGGRQTTVKQPLPLPEGVSDYAVGGTATTGYGAANGKSCEKMAAPSANYEVDEAVVEQDSVAYAIVETAASYKGGESAMKKFLLANIVKPQSAVAAGISGTVYLQFVVEASGEISNVTVLRGIGFGCDEEAVRVILLMKNKWKPAKQGNHNVATTMTLSIKF